MISAPVRTPELTARKPVVKTQGHLALLEWDDMPIPVAAPAAAPSDPIRRSVMDRCYDGGTLVLMAVTIAALAASLARF